MADNAGQGQEFPTILGPDASFKGEVVPSENTTQVITMRSRSRPGRLSAFLSSSTVTARERPGNL